uniref:Zinc transporter ZIP10 n=1 Tax=Mesocestoides corti TaxID=53468 RepID=A0A5K3EHM3_MESCO
MCANCKHTGCWIFLGVLYFVATSSQAQTVSSSATSGSNSAKYDLSTLSLTSPEVAALINETGSKITSDDLVAFVKARNGTDRTISHQALYDFISSFNGTVTQEESDHGHSHETGAFQVKPIVWIASVVAVVIISAVGLLGVAVVPLVNKSYYNDVIQFLVALAVGCLTGDAFLHLLPHAIAGGHEHSREGVSSEGAAEEREAVLKGLVALVGIYFFFLAEKLVSTISEYRTEKAADKEERERILKNPRKSTEGMRRLSTFRESISVNSSFRRGSRLPPTPEAANLRRSSRAPSIIADDILTTGLTAKAMKTVDVLNAYIEEAEEEDEQEMPQRNESGNLTLQVPTLKVIPDVTVTGDSPTHKKGTAVSSDKDGQSNSLDLTSTDAAQPHGHSHNLPRSMASVAWMVIMGDGLHNFTDGMAIGIAFAVSIAGGISTTVAVFCHELPHELGDFAVLLKTGMGIKEALFFNVVSSVLCLIGMLVGIGVGNVEAASAWIFAFTAGTFVYIALVDMLPELSSFQVKPDQSRIVQLILQNAGLITGAGIMLLIAMYEEQLLHLVG